MSVENYNVRCGASVRDGGGNRLGWKLSRKLGCIGSRDGYTEETVQGVEREVGKRGLERGVGADVTEDVSESAVVENSKAASNGSLAVLPWIPTKSEPGFDILIVGVVELVSRTRAHDAERQWLTGGEGTWILQQVGEVSAGLIGNTIELVAQSQVQGEVGTNLPCVLTVPVKLVLFEEFVIRGLAHSTLVEKLGLRILNHEAPIGIRTIHQVPVISDVQRIPLRIDLIHNPGVEAAKVCLWVEDDLTARGKIIKAALANITEIETELERMGSMHPAKALAVADGSRLSGLSIGPSQGAGETAERKHIVIPAVSDAIHSCWSVQNVGRVFCQIKCGIDVVPAKLEIVDQVIAEGRRELREQALTDGLFLIRSKSGEDIGEARIGIKGVVISVTQS